MTDLSHTVWANILASIKSDVTEQTFETWIRPIRFLSASKTDISLGVPNKFFKNWLIDHYTEIMDNATKKVCGRPIPVVYKIVHEEARAVSGVGVAAAEISSPGERGAAQGKEGEKGETSRQLFPFLFRKPAPAPDTQLNPKFTFDSFVIGPGNRFAHAAALAVAESPAKAYNPLFIYGKVGLGKTHLMQSIGHYLLQKRPGARFIYISSEKFTNQLISAIQNRTTAKFREMYRNADLLLIDDIHFIAGKESTQEEFFHTFNTLYDAHKQIVVSSDRLPKEISALEERLVSRFEWGLVTDIQPPDLETRIAILRKKAEREMINIPDDVTVMIAEKVKSNIRELEGALIRVVAYSTLVGKEKEIDVALVKEVLKDMFLEEAKKITIDLIQNRVAEYFDIRVSDMRVKKRTRIISYPRQIAMYLARELTDFSLPEIGQQFGGRDHTTVLHAYEKVLSELKKNNNFSLTVQKIIRDIKG